MGIVQVRLQIRHVIVEYDEYNKAINTIGSVQEFSLVIVLTDTICFNEAK
jgi:hypothetical protein